MMMKKKDDKPVGSWTGPVSTKQKVAAYFQLSMLLVGFMVLFMVINHLAKKADAKNYIDYNSAELIQYMLPDDGTPIVVYETNLGTFKAVLFPEQAPEYCKYFMDLADSGYYDGSHVFAVQDGVYFMGGSKTADGTDDDNTDKTDIKPETHRDLWPFYGAIAAYGNRKSLFNSQIQAGSRDLFIGSIEFTDELIEQLDSASGNAALNDAFKTRGGVPNFSQQYTIFAQVYDGFDAYGAVISAEAVDPNEENGDLRPKQDIVFTRVYLSTYGENRNDEFFTLGRPDGSGADTSLDDGR